MATITEASFLSAVQTINEYLSNYVLVFLLLGVGIWYTIKTKFVQIRCFKEGWNRVFGNISLNGKKGGGGMSSFQALATAIAAQVGTGIIVGVAGAILTGGPGAVFWMWVISFFGMATIYAEATLAQETRVVGEDGSIKGGPVYYITAVFKGRFGKFLAGLPPPSFWRSALWAAWCSPTPSAQQWKRPLGSSPGSSASFSLPSARSSSSAACSASLPLRRRSSP